MCSYIGEQGSATKMTRKVGENVLECRDFHSPSLTLLPLNVSKQTRCCQGLFCGPPLPFNFCFYSPHCHMLNCSFIILIVSLAHKLIISVPTSLLVY